MLCLRLGQLLDAHQDKIISSNSVFVSLFPICNSSKVPLLDLER